MNTAPAPQSTLTAKVEIKQNRPSENFTVWTPISIAAGEQVTFIKATNAGFRGIEYTVENAKGERFYHVSANLFTS